VNRIAGSRKQKQTMQPYDEAGQRIAKAAALMEQFERSCQDINRHLLSLGDQEHDAAQQLPVVARRRLKVRCRRCLNKSYTVCTMGYSSRCRTIGKPWTRLAVRLGKVRTRWHSKLST
jgi:septation ring formation regulator EzrA